MTVRVPPHLLDKFDQWVDEINAERTIKVSKTAVLLSLMLYGVKTKPRWAGHEPPDDQAASEQPPERIVELDEESQQRPQHAGKSAIRRKQ